MRIRTLLLITGIGLVAAFAALNVDEFTRNSVLVLGFTTVNVPLGLVMLALLVATLLVFLVTTIYIQSAHLIETRQYARELSTQRELADNAETSRFTELRHIIESQVATAQERELAAVTQSNESHVKAQAALLARLDVSDNTTAAYMGQLGDRLELSSAFMPTRASA